MDDNYGLRTKSYHELKLLYWMSLISKSSTMGVMVFWLVS